MKERYFDKTEDATRNISYDWTRFLKGRLPSGTTLSSVVWSASPTSLTLSNDVISGNVSTVTTSGGLKGTEYIIKLKATLSNSEIEEVHIPMSVVEYKYV